MVVLYNTRLCISLYGLKDLTLSENVQLSVTFVEFFCLSLFS